MTKNHKVGGLHLSLSLSALSLLVACGGEERPAPVLPSSPAQTTPAPQNPDEPIESMSVLKKLTKVGSDLGVDEQGSTIGFTVAKKFEPIRVHEALLPAIGGKLKLRADDRFDLVFMDLRFDLGDIIIPPEDFPNKGLHISDITAVVAPTAPFRTVWSDGGNAAEFSGEVALKIEWTLQADEGPIELRPLDLAKVELSGGLAKDAVTGAVVMDLTANAAGDLWDWGGLFGLSDLSLSLVLAEPAPAGN